MMDMNNARVNFVFENDFVKLRVLENESNKSKYENANIN